MSRKICENFSETLTKLYKQRNEKVILDKFAILTNSRNS